MNIFYYLSLSYLLIAVVIMLSTILSKKNIIGAEGSRKLIHIGVSNWYFLVILFMSDPKDIWITLIPPISFVVLNYLSYKKNIIKSMERGGKGNFGTVYYPISILLLVIFSIVIVNNPYIGLMGIMIMGYGDGFAAVIGSKYESISIGNSKTALGSLTMFLISLLVSGLIIYFVNDNSYLWMALVIALLATFLEYITPRGVDNLTVPIGSSLLYYLLLLI